GLARPAGRGRTRLRALRRGQPGAAGRAADHPAQPDLFRAVPARRRPARGAHHRLIAWGGAATARRAVSTRGAARPSTWCINAVVPGPGSRRAWHLLRDDEWRGRGDNVIGERFAEGPAPP